MASHEPAASHDMVRADNAPNKVAGPRRKLPKPLRRADTIQEGEMPLTLFHLQTAGAPLRKERSFESLDDNSLAPPPEALLPRRKALVPEHNKYLDTEKRDDYEMGNADSDAQGCRGENVIIVPHMQISPGDLHLYNRAITNRGGLLTELQKATTAAQAFCAETEEGRKPKAPWIFKRLDKTAWSDFYGLSESVSLPELDQKRMQAIWELFHSELVFLQKHLLAIRNVYKEPLKDCQVEGCLLFVEPDLLFGNLEELCQVSYGFCRSFLQSLNEVKSLKVFSSKPLVQKLFNKFTKGPSTVAAYQAYCINYKATMEYLESVRKTDDRFVVFEKLCESDSRCQRLQLEDLLIAPLHRITRLPLLLREILKYSKSPDEKAQIEEIIENVQDALRSIDDSIQWLHNFERLQELQGQLIWPSIFELEPRIFVPDFLKLALSRQFCENLLAHPRRILIHEGPLSIFENQKQTDTYVFLFNDMLLLTKVKKTVIQRSREVLKKLTSTYFEVIIAMRTEVLHLNHAFVILHLTRFYQVVNVYTFQAPNKESKEVWIKKFQESIERYESIQLKDMLKCTPLLPKSKSQLSPVKSAPNGLGPLKSPARGRSPLHSPSASERQFFV